MAFSCDFCFPRCGMCGRLSIVNLIRFPNSVVETNERSFLGHWIELRMMNYTSRSVQFGGGCLFPHFFPWDPGEVLRDEVIGKHVAYG